MPYGVIHVDMSVLVDNRAVLFMIQGKWPGLVFDGPAGDLLIYGYKIRQTGTEPWHWQDITVSWISTNKDTGAGPLAIT